MPTRKQRYHSHNQIARGDCGFRTLLCHVGWEAQMFLEQLHSNEKEMQNLWKCLFLLFLRAPQLRHF